MVLIESAGELSNSRRHLQALIEEALLALETNVLGPTHKAGEIAPGLEIATDAKVARPALEQVSGDDPLGLCRCLSGSLGSGLCRGLLRGAGLDYHDEPGSILTANTSDKQSADVKQATNKHHEETYHGSSRPYGKGQNRTLKKIFYGPPSCRIFSEPR